MKSLSSNTARVLDTPHPKPIMLLKLEFTSPASLTLYLSSRPFKTRNTFDGQVYDPIILSWPPIRSGEIEPIRYTGRPGDMSVDILNCVPVGGYDRFTDLVHYYDWAYATATAYFVHEGAMDAGDEITVFKGKVENPGGMNRGKISLQISDISLSFLNSWPHTIVTTDDYPDADPDDLGKMLPQVWGSCKRVPFMAVDAGWLTTLAEDLDSSETSVDLTDVAGLPAATTIQIDSEKISYTGKAGNTLTGCTRGASGTTAVAHDLGATVAEIQADYFYVMDHAVKAINAVYVADILQPAANYTAYTGQSGDAHATYPGKACIKFATLPVIVKQVNVAANDTIAVNEDIDINDPKHDHTNEDGTLTWEFDKATVLTGTVWFGYALCDGDFSTITQFKNSNAEAEIECVSFRNNSGTPTKYRLCCYIHNLYQNDQFQIRFDGRTNTVYYTYAITTASPKVYRSQWYDVKTTSDTWDELLLLKMEIDFTENLPHQDLHIGLAWLEVEYTITSSEDSTGITKTGAATKSGTVTITGNSVADTVIGGRVSADIDGYQDDGSGTYTGTANALIERPDHIFKHWIMSVLGLSASEIDNTSYTASGTEYSSNSFTHGICLLKPPKIEELFSKAARQCRSLQVWDAGVHHLIYMSGSETTDKTISGHRIDLNQLWLDYTIRSEIRNDLTGTYNKYWSGYDEEIEAARAVVASAAAASITKYGSLAESVVLDYIDGATMAGAILDHIRDDLDEPRLLVNFIGDPSLMDVERGDVIEFDVTEDNLNKALLGLVSEGDQFRVLDKVYMPKFKEQIKCVKI